MAEKLLHFGPGFLVGFLIVGRSLAVVVAGIRPGKGVDRARIGNEFVFRMGLVHLALEGGDFSGVYHRIVGAVQHKDRAADVFGVRGRGIAQAPMKSDHAFQGGAAPGEFQGPGAAEAVANDGHLARRDEFVLTRSR